MHIFERFVAWLSVLTIILTTQLLAASPIQTRKAEAGVVPTLSGSAVTIGAGTYPRANFLKDGSILGIYTKFENGQTILTTTRSTDGGASWSDIGAVSSVESATHDTDNPYVLQLPSGRVLAAFRNHDKTTAGVYTFFRITVCYSDDGGVTWAYLSQPASDPGPVNGNWEPFLRNALDGSLQIYYSRENSAADQDSLMRTSIDGGATWSDATTISGAELSSSRDGMLGVATITGSTLIAVFETETSGGPFNIQSVMSSDDGKTWGNRRPIYTPSQGGANAPQVINVGGTMVVSFQTDEDSPGSPAWKIVTSGDGAQTFGNKITVFDAKTYWGGLLALDAGNFLGLADNGGAKSQKVTLG